MRWLWLAAALGLSPVLLDLLGHMAREPWSRAASLFAPLAALAFAGTRRGPPRYDGIAWLGGAALWELAAIALRALPHGRPALALAVVGLGRLAGIASWPRLLLAAWLVPVPMLLQQRASPALEQRWLELASRVAPGSLLVEGSLVTAPSGALWLDAPDGGLPLAALLSGLAWAGASARGFGLMRCALWALAGAALAIPLQLVVVVAAVSLLGLDAPDAARWLLAPGAWMLAALPALRWLRSRGRGSLAPP
jgi:hypothetical protein